MVSFWAAKIEGDRFLYERTEVRANRWIDTPPYATEQDVLIQGFDKKISLGWVNSRLECGEGGIYKIAGQKGGKGPKPIKCYMIIPFPFEDRKGWNVTAAEEIEKKPKENRPYIVTLEVRESCRVTYRLDTAYYDTKTYRWMGCTFGDCTAEVAAWREFPHPKRG